MLMHQTLKLTDANFAREVLRSSKPTLVEVWSGWRQLSLPLARIAAERRGRVRIAALNLDENPALGARLRINVIPTLLYFARGQMQARAFGCVSEQVIRATVANSPTAEVGESLPTQTSPETSLGNHGSGGGIRRILRSLSAFAESLFAGLEAPKLVPDAFGLLPWRFDSAQRNDRDGSSENLAQSCARTGGYR